jgi:DNA mismatch repair protein MutS
MKAASLQAWGADALPEAHAAAAAVLGFAEHTQGRALTHLHNIRVQRSDELIDLPQTTRRNLELVQTLRGEDAPTLFSLLDTCLTGMGSRMLKSWLLAPQRDRAQARQRLAAVTTLRDNHGRPCAPLKGTSDVERITARIALRQVRPRELVALQQSLQKSEHLAQYLQRLQPDLAYIAAPLQPPAGCAALLARAILEEPAALVRDGGVIAHGFDADLDELRGIQDNCDAFLLDLETRERPAPALPTCACSSTRCTASTSRSRRARWTRCPQTTAAARR